MKRFEGKVAVITGASTGLGPVMAKMMVDEGAKVVIAARRKALVEEVAHGIGADAVPVQADVTNEDDVARMVVAAMDNWGQVDVLMSNAAIPGTDRYVWEQTRDNFIATYEVDCMAAMLCSKEVLNRSMIERRQGAIVTFSSGAGWVGLPRKSHYSAAKGALRIFTKTLAREIGQYNVRANCVVPGAITTDLLLNYQKRIAAEQGVDLSVIQDRQRAEAVLKDDLLPGDVANLALFLASDQGRMITGQSINVDAGWHLV
jgi:3-oxoacyl-[acyl-carrier protein] reductase